MIHDTVSWMYNFSDASRHLNLALMEEKNIVDILKTGSALNNSHPFLINIGNDYLKLAEESQRWSDYWFKIAVEDENHAFKLVQLSRR